MDDRKKKISELEGQIKDNQASLNNLFEGLGKTLLSCPEITNANEKTFPELAVFQDIEEYRLLQKEIEKAEDSIKNVEIYIARLRELEQDIEAGEQEESCLARELTGFYSKLGKLVLEAPGLDAFSGSFRIQADALIPKIQSLETRLAELGNQTEGGNVFTWIGKSTQSMVLRSFLNKSLENLERLFRNAGEQFYRSEVENNFADSVSGIEIIDLCKEIGKNKNASAAIAEKLKKLKEEHRKIDSEFQTAGGPLKKIQSLQKNISSTQEKLKTLYLHFGLAASSDKQKPDTAKKKTKGLTAFLSESEQTVLDDIKQLRQNIQDDKTAIEKLRAALEIDEEKEKIEKLRRSITEKKARITEAERSIAEYESRISSAEKHIEELRQLL